MVKDIHYDEIYKTSFPKIHNKVEKIIKFDYNNFKFPNKLSINHPNIDYNNKNGNKNSKKDVVSIISGEEEHGDQISMTKRLIESKNINEIKSKMQKYGNQINKYNLVYKTNLCQDEFKNKKKIFLIKIIYIIF